MFPPSLTDCYHSDIRLCLCLFTRACLSSSNCSLAPSRSVATLSVSLRESLAFVIVSLFRWRRPSPPTYPTLLLLQTLQESCKQTHEQTQRNKESGEVEQSMLTCIVRIVVSSSSPPLLPRLFHSAFLFHFFGFCVPSHSAISSFRREIH